MPDGPEQADDLPLRVAGPVQVLDLQVHVPQDGHAVQRLTETPATLRSVSV